VEEGFRTLMLLRDIGTLARSQAKDSTTTGLRQWKCPLETDGVDYTGNGFPEYRWPRPELHRMAAVEFCGLGKGMGGYENGRMDSRVLFDRLRIGAYSAFIVVLSRKGKFLVGREEIGLCMGPIMISASYADKPAPHTFCSFSPQELLKCEARGHLQD
jgi:hypothetical protein